MAGGRSRTREVAEAFDGELLQDDADRGWRRRAREAAGGAPGCARSATAELAGAGVVIVNPPAPSVEAHLRAALPWLCELMKQGEGAAGACDRPAVKPENQPKNDCQIDCFVERSLGPWKAGGAFTGGSGV